MPDVLICDAIAEDGIQILQQVADVTVKTGLKEAELIAEVPRYDALMVRSATKITRPVLEAAKQLQIVGRAGVGVDNIDVAQRPNAASSSSIRRRATRSPWRN
jgi:D-3-phosphoglycerate dehydrogenase